MLRLILLLVALPFQALADPAPPLCQGRYAAAEEMLDAAWKRGATLYSGGPTALRHGPGVGATIDLWRLWQGLPDQRFRDAGTFDPSSDWGADYSKFGQSQQDLNLILHIANRPGDRPISLFHRYLAAVYLNDLVSVGPGPGWWLDPRQADFYPIAPFIVAEAKPYSLMEWLMITMAASDTPGAVAWFRPGDGNWRRDSPYSRSADILELTKTRQAGDAGLAWFVARSLFDRKFKDGQPQLADKVNACTASNAEYAANAVWTWQRLSYDGLYSDPALLDALPQGMRIAAMKNLAMLTVTRYPYDFSPLGKDWLQTLADRAPTPEFAVWLSAGQSWLAGTLPDLIAANQGERLNYRVYHSLNVLSVDDLIAFEAGAGMQPEDRTELVKLIAARAFVLGRLDVARTHLNRLADLPPDYAARVSAALSGPGGDEVQIARAILALPSTSVLLGQGRWSLSDWRVEAGHRMGWRAFDMPAFWQSAGNLDRNLNVWLSENAGRAYRRGRAFADTPDVPFISKDGYYDRDLPFASLIAFDELARFGQCNGLKSRLSRVLLEWVDSQNNWWNVWADDDDLADVLSQIVILNSRQTGIVIDGKPAGQRAFALLTQRYPDTVAAKDTPYWYHTDRNCRG